MYRIAIDRFHTEGPQCRFFSERLYTRAELRAAVDSIAAGRPWGWRPEAGGSGVMEAVCDYQVIARAAVAK